MRFGSLALGIVVACAAPPGTARAFLPSPSMRGEGPLVPKDLLGKYNLRLVKSSYAFTDTLRWEMRSTLTSDEEGGGDGDDRGLRRRRRRRRGRSCGGVVIDVGGGGRRGGGAGGVRRRMSLPSSSILSADPPNSEPVEPLCK